MLYQDFRIFLLIKKPKEIGVSKDATLLVSVGKLNEKNYEASIRAIAQLNNLDIHYVRVGEVDKEAYLLGYRTDAAEFYKKADIYLVLSMRECLNVSFDGSYGEWFALCCR